MKKLSAIIACYKDAQAIPVMHERLSRTFAEIGVEYEIIFVNDGSPDNTEEVLAEITGVDKRTVAVHHTRNFGSQNAFASGMKIATGDAVVLLDGDLQDPPELIKEFHKKWEEGYDIVYGVRVKREGTAFLRVAYRAFYRVFKAVSYLEIPLDAGDFSLIGRKAVDAINALPERNRFLRGIRAWVGFKQIGVPYNRPERMFGKSTNSLLKNIGWAGRGIISFSYIPLNLIVFLAAATMGMALLGMGGQIAARLIWPGSVAWGITTVISVILFVGAVQLLCLSVIGSYLAQIYEEVKRRPISIIGRIDNKPNGIGGIGDTRENKDGPERP